MVRATPHEMAPGHASLHTEVLDDGHSWSHEVISHVTESSRASSPALLPSECHCEGSVTPGGAKGPQLGHLNSWTKESVSMKG